MSDITQSLCETRLIHMWQKSFCDRSLLYMSDITQSLCETRLIHMWQKSFMWCMRHSRNTSLKYSRRTRHMRDTTHSYVTEVFHVRHDAIISETWLITMWDMFHSYVSHDLFYYVRHDSCHDSFICEPWLILLRKTWLVTWLIHMWAMTHSYATRGINA